jgi:hypothetical protein
MGQATPARLQLAPTGRILAILAGKSRNPSSQSFILELEIATRGLMAFKTDNE